MSYKLPTDGEIRARILGVNDKQKRMAFMYQYLVLGRIIEVCGKYMPLAGDAFEVNFSHEGEDYPAVLFAVKTAKRRGKLRPVALPLDKEYEPWAPIVYDYINGFRVDEKPFSLHDNPETSKTYAMKDATEMFTGLMWPMIDYSRTTTKPYTEDMVISTRYGDDGYEEYLVSFPDGSRGWTSDRDAVKFSVKIEPRWKHGTSHIIRKRRTLTLVMDYRFSGISLAIVGGWTLKTQEQSMPGAIKHYLHLDITSAKDNVKLLKRLAERYFYRLLTPYEHLYEESLKYL